MLGQQASGYDIGGCNFHIQEQPMHENFNFSCAGIDQSAKSTDQVGSVDSPWPARSLRPRSSQIGLM